MGGRLSHCHSAWLREETLEGIYLNWRRWGQEGVEARVEMEKSELNVPDLVVVQWDGS